FDRLLPVRIGQLAAADGIRDVAERGLVELHVLLGEAQDLRLQDNLEVLPGDFEADEFAALEYAERGAIDAGCLPVGFGLPETAVDRLIVFVLIDIPRSAPAPNGGNLAALNR